MSFLRKSLSHQPLSQIKEQFPKTVEEAHPLTTRTLESSLLQKKLKSSELSRPDCAQDEEGGAQ